MKATFRSVIDRVSFFGRNSCGTQVCHRHREAKKWSSTENKGQKFDQGTCRLTMKSSFLGSTWYEKQLSILRSTMVQSTVIQASRLVAVLENADLELLLGKTTNCCLVSSMNDIWQTIRYISGFDPLLRIF